MTTEQHKRLIRRLVEEFWKKGNAAVIDEVYASGFVDHDAPPRPVPGREGYQQSVVTFRAAFSDISTTIDDMLTEGDKVAWRWTFRGVQTGTVMGVPPTNREITVEGIVIDRFEGGQIVERWSQTDFLGMMQQLGVIPVPGEGG